MAMVHTALGDNLRVARLTRGLSAARLGELAGVAPSHISSIETGKRPNPGAFTLYAIARVLGVRLEDLMGVPRVERTTKGRSNARRVGNVVDFGERWSSRNVTS